MRVQKNTSISSAVYFQKNISEHVKDNIKNLPTSSYNVGDSSAAESKIEIYFSIYLLQQELIEPISSAWVRPL